MFQVIKAREFNKKLKVSIQASGKLSFTSETASAMGLDQLPSFKFAKDDENNSQLCMIKVRTHDEDSFRTLRSGTYYYLPTKLMFDALLIDYQSQTVLFDLVRRPDLDESLEGEVFFMNMRTLPKGKSDTR